MKSIDLLTATVFGKRCRPKNITPGGPHFGVQNLDPKMGAAITRNVFGAPVLGSNFRTPKRGPAFGFFLVVSA